MELDFAKKLNQMNASWNDACFQSGKSLTLFGPKGSGKTRIAQDFARSHKGVFYLSFEHQDPRAALAQFCRMFLSEYGDIHNWDDAVKAFLASRQSGRKLIIFEDEQNASMEQCRAAFRSQRGGMRNLIFCFISRECKETGNRNVSANYFTIADVCRSFPAYAKQDAVRLHQIVAVLDVFNVCDHSNSPPAKSVTGDWKNDKCTDFGSAHFLFTVISCPNLLSQHTPTA